VSRYANNDDELGRVITEALAEPGGWAEGYLRQRFHIEPHKSISMWLDEIAAGEPDDPFARSQM
jgi:hypothetical protein